MPPLHKSSQQRCSIDHSGNFSPCLWFTYAVLNTTSGRGICGERDGTGASLILVLRSEYSVSYELGEQSSIPGRSMRVLVSKGPSHTSIQCLPGGGGSFLGLMWARRETEDSAASTTEVKNGGTLPPLLHTSYNTKCSQSQPLHRHVISWFM
jgi:hypothetical protein